MILSCCLFASAMAQQRRGSSELTNGLFSLYMLTPGFSYEQKLARNMSVSVNVQLSFQLAYQNNNGFTQSYYAIRPYVNPIFRYYYNLEKRAQAGKYTNRNSGNFVGFTATRFLPTWAEGGTAFLRNDRPVDALDFIVGPIWGIQRTQANDFTIDFSLGYGLYSYDGELYPTPIVNLNLGFVIFSGQ